MPGSCNNLGELHTKYMDFVDSTFITYCSKYSSIVGVYLNKLCKNDSESETSHIVSSKGILEHKQLQKQSESWEINEFLFFKFACDVDLGVHNRH